MVSESGRENGLGHPRPNLLCAGLHTGRHYRIRTSLTRCGFTLRRVFLLKCSGNFRRSFQWISALVESCRNPLNQLFCCQLAVELHQFGNALVLGHFYVRLYQQVNPELLRLCFLIAVALPSGSKFLCRLSLFLFIHAVAFERVCVLLYHIVLVLQQKNKNSICLQLFKETTCVVEKLTKDGK